VITPDTLALAEGYIEVKSLGPVAVKGLADAVEVYEVTGTGPARTRLQASSRRGLTRFAGRDGELEQLRRAQQLAGEGHGQMAAIVGEAGVGTSRLVHALTHDVTYGGLLGESRRALHVRVVGTIRALHGDPTAEHLMAPPRCTRKRG
jgi:hypothetical protein